MCEISPDSRAARGERQGEGPGDWPQASQMCESDKSAGRGVALRAQSSRWLTMPSASFGSNQVDFGGMIAPASATAIRSVIWVG